ncbi:predicted protein [Sclerotinia sclerotiorum 1980 UF-70]|uniref:Uncharacterized protein n=1 Tax=Sclerotinia sclerotiorum (strain ATCC 18683 / 1980 / Ss-1) TaxID=665079 RepID=A7EM85_SCLS1|nr:predicted protein [Sclerotinia sclerotiorum 1980 UF-70]EDO03951.1 predicted protein [Sclerotinia sclerotiorum 1980 UF-70]
MLDGSGRAWKNPYSNSAFVAALCTGEDQFINRK